MADSGAQINTQNISRCALATRAVVREIVPDGIEEIDQAAKLNGTARM